MITYLEKGIIKSEKNKKETFGLKLPNPTKGTEILP